MACHAKSDTGYMHQEQEMMQNTQKNLPVCPETL